MAKIVDLSNETFLSLGEPSDIGIASISMKLRYLIGEVNLLLNTSFSLNSSYDIVDEDGVEIDINAAAILKKLYECFYYNKNANSSLGAAGIEVREVSDDGAKVVNFDRVSISKGFVELRKSAKEELQNLVNGYKVKKYAPAHVTSDDNLSTYDANNNSSTYYGGV
jgi:hypothetical protein